MPDGSVDLAAAMAAIGLAEGGIEFPTYYPDPVPLQDYIAWAKENAAKLGGEPLDDAEGGVSIFDTDLKDVYTDPVDEANDIVNDTLDDINDKVSEADQQAQEEADDIFKDMEGATFVTTFPVLDFFTSIQGGLMDFTDLPAAVAGSIQNNIMFSLEFLQNENLADLASKGSALVEATVESGKGIIEVVADSVDGLLQALVRAIDEALELVASILLDPIGTLLQAILAAIRGIPGAVVNLALESLLKEAPEGLLP